MRLMITMQQSKVIDELSKKFFVAVVAYTGFDDKDSEDYTNVEVELEKIENRYK